MEQLSRRKSRENAFIALFSTSFNSNVQDVLAGFGEDESEFAVDEFGEGLLDLYEQHADEVDRQIEARLKGWKVQRLPRVSLAILRLAVAEILYGPPDMDSVAINEAVELAKRFGGEDDYQFINGVLGNVARTKPGAADGKGMHAAGSEDTAGAADAPFAGTGDTEEIRPPAESADAAEAQPTGTGEP